MPARFRYEVPFERNGSVEPGRQALLPGVERYVVPGGGSCTVRVEENSEIGILNLEGDQGVELVFFPDQGKSDAGLLGTKGSGVPLGTIEVLNSSRGLDRFRQSDYLRSRINLAEGDAVRIHGPGTAPGTLRTFTCSATGTLIVSTPGDKMLPWEQTPLTEVALYIRKAEVSEIETMLPPSPLAEPLVDSNIQPGEAFVYEVRKGEYIQILDVQGRECSDFQAFALRSLDEGVEREIDPTATRSLNGMIYPQPGLHSKFYNVDFEPLVQIVQDTCGRHDAFGVACTAKYYEDMGYPGHKNCSENMSRNLAPYNVRSRNGWPAVNFFFNTALDRHNAMILDDPWSRPGDFVLLRALTDLVCVSSACPCDIDPSNAWNPTDIQVRTYTADEAFKPFVGYRKTTEGTVTETKKTGFHDRFALHTRDFVEYSGYWLPNTITNQGAIAEYWACREKVVIMDLSPLRKCEVTGPDAENLLQYCVTRNIRKLAKRQVVYTAMCYEHGGMIDDGTVFRLAENNFRWVGGSDDSVLWLQEQCSERKFDAHVRDSTDQLHNVAVQGPSSRDVLAKLLWTPPTEAKVEELDWFRFSIARIGGPQGVACIVSRTGYTGELGYEIFCHPDDAAVVFDAIWDAGQEYGLVPFGLEALDLVRIESGLVFAGYEFCDQTDPFEAGIGFTTPLKSKTEDFIGREALVRRKNNPTRKLVGLEIDSSVVPSQGDCIRIGKAQVGEITSAMRSPILAQTIALARVDMTCAETGTAVQVGQLDGHQKKLIAKVVPFPHFDPRKQRVRGNYN